MNQREIDRVKIAISDLVGKPYIDEEQDCYWFLRRVFAEAGLEVSSNPYEAWKDFEEIKGERRFLDIVYTAPSRGERGLSIVYSRTDVALCSRGTNGVAIVPFAWLRNIKGTYRHRHLCD